MSVIHRALSQSESEQQRQSSGYNPLAVKSGSGRRPAWPWFISLTLMVATLLVVVWPEASVQQPATIAQTMISDAPVTNDEPSSKQPAAPMTEESDPAHSAQNKTVSDETIEYLIPAAPTQTPAPEPDNAVAPTPDSAAPETDTPATTEATPSVQEATPTVAPTDTQVVDQVETSPKPTPADAATASDTKKTVVSAATVVRRAEAQWQADIEQAIQNGAIEQAEAMLKRWIGAQPKAEPPRLWLAKIYINNGIYPAAEPLIQTLKSAEAKALMGVIYERTGRHSQAAEVFESLYRSQPDQGRWLLFWAINTENSRQLVKSRQLYQTYLDQFSQDDESLQRFAAQRLQAIGGS